MPAAILGAWALAQPEPRAQPKTQKEQKHKAQQGFTHSEQNGHKRGIGQKITGKPPIKPKDGKNIRKIQPHCAAQKLDPVHSQMQLVSGHEMKRVKYALEVPYLHLPQGTAFDPQLLIGAFVVL